MRRIISAILAIILCVSLASCSNGLESSVQTPEEVNLKLYLYSYGRDYDDSKLVLEEINKILTEKTNTTIDYTLDLVDDAIRKIPLILASEEYYDGIAMPADVYTQELQKGNLMEIGELLYKYMPNRMQNMTEYDYASIAFNEGLYGVPGGFQWFTPQGYMLRGDLRKKYGVPEVTDLEGLQVYMDTLIKNEPGTIPFNTSVSDSFNLTNNFLGAAGWVDIGNNLGYYMSDAALTLSYAYETPEFKELLETTKQFANNGYWPQNAHTASTISRDAFASGTSYVATSHVVNANDMAIAFKSRHPEWEVEFFMIPDPTVRRPSRGRGMTIPKYSRNPEKLLTALELFATDLEINALLINGIEGLHYTVNADGSIINTPEGASRYPTDAFPLAWSNRNLTLMRHVSGGIKEFVDVQGSVDELSVIHKHTGFIAQIQDISDELAAVNNVLTSMKGRAQFGVFDSSDELLGEYKLRMEQAGASVVKDEIQRQLDEFMAKD